MFANILPKNQIFCPALDLRPPLRAEATCEQTLGNPWPHWALLCPEWGSDRARWPGRRGVEVLRGPATGARAVWLLPAGPFCQFHARQQFYFVWGPRDIQLERYDLRCSRLYQRKDFIYREGFVHMWPFCLNFSSTHFKALGGNWHGAHKILASSRCW